MLRKLIIAFGLLFGLQAMAHAQETISPALRTSTGIMNGFMDLRFGMFIHWGPVTLKGTEIGWSRGTQVPVKVYDNLYKKFDPVLFNADTWVKTAKDAGMKYLVIVAKHHDGFCLWPSAYTDYNIASTPFKKDVVGALAKACRKQGIKFCIYYSVLDWHQPDYPYHSPKDSVWDPKSNMGKYIIYMKNQLKELITRYHPYMLWFDGNWEKPWTQEEAVNMYQYIKSLDKNVIINNRLGKGDHTKLTPQSVGDYATPEQKIGTIDMNHQWESCITIGTQWAWKPNDKIKSFRQCIDILANTAGGNGNLLLNVSPMSNGEIEARVIKRLKEIGDWMKKYGGAIYDTHGGPYKPNKIFTSTRKGNEINILLLQPMKGVFTLPALNGYKVLSAQFMGGAEVKFTQDDKGIHLTLPGTLPEENCSVIVLKLNMNTNDIPLIDYND
jgi:alpha-L-fucosidase